MPKRWWDSPCCQVWVLLQQALLPVNGAVYRVLSPHAPWTTIFPLEVVWAASKHQHLACPGGACLLSTPAVRGQNRATVASPAPVACCLIYKYLLFFYWLWFPPGEVGVKVPKLNIFCSVTKRNGWADISGLKGEKRIQLRANPILDAGLIHGTQQDAFRGVVTHWLELNSNSCFHNQHPPGCRELVYLTRSDHCVQLISTCLSPLR